jgi:hypothetical protein
MTRFPILALLLLTFTTPIFAGELKVGDSLPSFTLEDQNGKPHTNDVFLRFLVFATDRASSQIVTDTFKGQTTTSLQGHGIVYIADIEKMPSLVASMFALPKMRKQPYPILLGKKVADTAWLPRQPNCVAVVGLKDGTITAITFSHSLTELRTALGFVPAASYMRPDKNGS